MEEVQFEVLDAPGEYLPTWSAQMPVTTCGGDREDQFGISQPSTCRQINDGKLTFELSIYEFLLAARA
jgi:hypothetical protein